MGLSGILFNPRGRITPAEFWRGLIVLIGLNVILSVASVYTPVAIASVLGIASLLLIYPLICVYGKRFHDNGRTAWLVLAVLVGYVIVLTVLTMVLTPILAPDVAALQLELQEKLSAGEIGIVEMMEQAQAASGGSYLVMSIISSVAASLVTGFFVARLESDPDENEHGPATGVGSTFE